MAFLKTKHISRQDRLIKTFSLRQKGLVVVLENIADPHNAQAVLRTCDAFGVQHVYFIFEEVPGILPEEMAKSSSAATNRWITSHIYTSADDCCAVLKDQGYQICATTPPDSETESLFTADLINPELAFVFGNEKSGLSQTMLAYADRKLAIPMQGFVQSLNLSVAASICLYEVSRQRETSGQDFKICRSEREKLIQKFIEK